MPPHKISNKVRTNAKTLRHSQTDSEGKLWLALRSHQFENVHFRRQHPIGNYIADFCSPKHRLIIELDGSQHFDQFQYDERRTKYLESRGYKVLRFNNNDVQNNLDGVLIVIFKALGMEKS